MEPSNRKNINLLLESEFNHYNTVVDIGCGNCFDLFNFEYSPFVKLIGIDRTFKREPFQCYKSLKRLSYESGLLYKFNQRFEIVEMDFNEYDFSSNQISLIICNKVLHFYDDSRKYEIIERLYSSLQKNGLLYLKINHNRNPNNTDPGKTIQIGHNVFQNLNDESEIRYLIEPFEFIRNLSGAYEVIPKFTLTDDKTTQLVLKR